ncbi:MAG: helix-turn-helix domain-containing protein [Candidatus Acidiferrum sp.]
MLPESRDKSEVDPDSVPDHFAEMFFAAPVRIPADARRFQELREKSGLTRAQLAKRSGVDLSLIIRFEQGLAEITPEMAKTLADALR